MLCNFALLEILCLGFDKKMDGFRPKPILFGFKKIASFALYLWKVHNSKGREQPINIAKWLIVEDINFMCVTTTRYEENVV